MLHYWSRDLHFVGVIPVSLVCTVMSPEYRCIFYKCNTCIIQVCYYVTLIVNTGTHFVSVLPVSFRCTIVIHECRCMFCGCVTFRYVSENSFVDVHKVEGLRGVYIANKFYNSSSINNNKQRTVISFNKGASWNSIEVSSEFCV